MPDPDFRSEWFASAINEHSSVASTTTSPNGIVTITRKKLPPITAAPLGNPRIDKRLAEAVMAKAMPTAIVLVPKAGHYDWDAREFAMAKGSTILTVKELFTFMVESDPRPFLNKSVAYNRERLEQHSQAIDCRMICEASFVLRRRGPLSNVTVAIEYEYEFTEEAIVRAIRRHPDADLFLNANPSGTTTAAAYSHVRHAGRSIYNTSELMGALNYDGEQLHNYEPPERNRRTSYQNHRR
jgi:hypothetical protein